jgi:tetratricopeptide (TPR) repeat protein
MLRQIPWVVLLFALVGTLVAAGCKKVSSRQDLEKIQALEKKADSNREAAGTGAAALDSSLLSELGKAYLDWADRYPSAPETPEFLFRAGELYSNELQDFPKAIEVFKRDYQNYPEHETAANALFFIGYLYNNSLHDLQKAEQYYKEFLDKYPSHNMAKHAQFELESLGMTPDQVFAKIMKGDSVMVDSAGGRRDSVQ